MATSHACNFAVCAVNPRTHERQLVAHAFWGINFPTKQCTLTSTSGPARTSGSLGSALGPNASSQGAGGCAQCQGWISSTACHRRWRRRIWRRSPPPLPLCPPCPGRPRHCHVRAVDGNEPPWPAPCRSSMLIDGSSHQAVSPCIDTDQTVASARCPVAHASPAFCCRRPPTERVDTCGAAHNAGAINWGSAATAPAR